MLFVRKTKSVRMYDKSHKNPSQVSGEKDRPISEVKLRMN